MPSDDPLVAELGVWLRLRRVIRSEMPRVVPLIMAESFNPPVCRADKLVMRIDDVECGDPLGV